MFLEKKVRNELKSLYCETEKRCNNIYFWRTDIKCTAKGVNQWGHVP